MRAIEATWLSCSVRRCRTPLCVYNRASPTLRRLYAQATACGSSFPPRKAIPSSPFGEHQRCGGYVCITQKGMLFPFLHVFSLSYFTRISALGHALCCTFSSGSLSNLNIACPIQATVGQQFRDDHNSTRIMELKDRGNDNPSSAHCAYLRQTFCSSEVLRHEKGISNEYQHLQNISYSH